jgi:hypothetical protein
MTQSFTDALQHNRLIVVAYDHSTGHLRVKGVADACTDLTCSEQTLIVTDEGHGNDLRALNAGDIITLDGDAGRPRRITVVRRVWEEFSSPEW